ncbi:MAG: single-stranded DNA-binding protein [Catenisphaera adipataccumulans]|jgi:single-strand DNA-binding protein|uniref:single-stranded DNA-binding protein n=1 Tax=Catenisphaera adipataccumulans TaxID=700500 RepID=UPI003D9073FA
MVNRVVLIGRLTRDLELRRTQSGTSVLSFTLAVGRRSPQPGQPDADFINCVAWSKTAELMAQYLHKGSMCAVEGRIQTRNYENNQGQRVYVTEVVAESVQFLDSRSSANTGYQQSGNNYANSYRSDNRSQNSSQNFQQPAQNNSFEDFSDDQNDTLDIASDDLPF